MSVNSSSNSSLHPIRYDCLVGKKNISVTAVFVSIYYILLLPLIILVVYVGYKRWRKQRSVATVTSMSHFDIFTFNMVVVELIGVFGCCFYYVGSYMTVKSLSLAAVYASSVLSYGQTLFHILTCVDRYLAVVHPVTYLRLRQRGGVRIRNISIVCVWLFSFGSSMFRFFSDYITISYGFLVLSLCIVVISACNLSVLCALIRPGPGEVGGKRERVDQSKLRAFYTIMAIMGALLFRFLGNLVSYVIYNSFVLSDRQNCLLNMIVVWFSLPSSLVLPLLFLQRSGKLPGCKHNTASG